MYVRVCLCVFVWCGLFLGLVCVCVLTAEQIVFPKVSEMA